MRAARICIAATSLCFIASASRAQSDQVPKELALALIPYGANEGGEIVVGQLPPDLAANMTLPPGARVLGSFMSLGYGSGHPAQLVVGTGGDLDDAITNPPTPGTPIGDARLDNAFAMADYGFLVLDRDAVGWQGTFYGVENVPRARCRIIGRDLRCHAE